MHAEIKKNGKLVQRPGASFKDKLHFNLSRGWEKGKEDQYALSAHTYSFKKNERIHKKWKKINVEMGDHLEIVLKKSGRFEKAHEVAHTKQKPGFRLGSKKAAEEILVKTFEYLEMLRKMYLKKEVKQSKEFLTSIGWLHSRFDEHLLTHISLEFPSLHKKYPVLKTIRRGA